MVTVSNVFGNGTLGLNLADNGSIVDAAYPTLALSSTGFQPVSGGYPIFTGQVYTVASPFVWDGQGSDNNWTTGANWVGGQAPLPGSSLLFTGSAQTATDNDFPDGTAFQSVEIAGNSFALSGDDLALTGGITVDSGVAGASVSANIALDGPVTFDVEAASPLPPGEGQGEGASLTDSGVLSGAGDLTKLGSGILVLGGANSYGGNTTVGAGTLQVGNPSAIPSGSGCVNLEKRGMLDLDGNSIMIGALSGSGGVTNSASGTSTLTVGAGDQTSQFSGEIDDGSGSVALLKVAGGTLTLTGDNSYSGGTTIDGGTLDAPGPQDLPYSDAGDGVSVASGATLEVGVTVGGPDAGNTWASSLDALLANPDFTGGNLEIDLMSADADVMPSLADITSGIPFTFSTDMLGDRSLIVTGNSFLQLTGSGRYHGGLTLEDGATLLDPARRTAD